MKKQTDPQIKAHLLRSAFYLLLLLAVGVIPFALGQRSGANKQSVVTAPLLSGSTRDATLLDAECPPYGTWSFAGSLNTQRIYHTMTLLNNGQVLVAGGNDNNSNVLASVELYDPATGSWTYTGSLNTGRWDHIATLLADGKVLVAGGYDSLGSSLTTAELYDPASGTSTYTGDLNAARGAASTLTLLPGGEVLVAAGYTAELYDPASGTWTYTGSLDQPHYSHTATLLPNGMVLVAGSTDNYSFESAELYDPDSGTWSITGSLNHP